MRKGAGDASEPSALADPDLVVEPVDLAIARTNFARSQRLNCFGRALLKNALLERSNVRWDEIFTRQDKSSAAGHLERRGGAVRLEIESASLPKELIHRGTNCHSIALTHV
jgi:hypothetical protein